jgi:hypothetical protein
MLQRGKIRSCDSQIKGNRGSASGRPVIYVGALLDVPSVEIGRIDEMVPLVAY